MEQEVDSVHQGHIKQLKNLKSAFAELVERKDASLKSYFVPIAHIGSLLRSLGHII